MSNFNIKVLVVGDAILDHYVFGEVNRQSPEDETIPVIDIEKEEYRLGGCLNVASNIRSLSFSWNKKDKNFDISLSSVFSPFTGKIIEGNGIRADSSCITLENRLGDVLPSSDELIKTRVINKKTEKQLIRIDNRKKYREQDIELYKSVLGSHFNGYDAVVVSDYCKGLVNGHTINLLEKYEGQVFIDTKQHDLSLWSKIPNCIVKVNDNEYYLSEKSNTLKQLIVTCGDSGADLYENGNFVKKYLTKSVKDPEVTGAGDVFLAGLVVKYMRTKDMEESIKFANDVATESVKKKGTTQVWRR